MRGWQGQKAGVSFALCHTLVRPPTASRSRSLPVQYRRKGKVPESLVGMSAALRHLRLVLVQDALELAPRFPDHPVHVWLAEQPEWAELLEKYHEAKQNKVRRERVGLGGRVGGQAGGRRAGRGGAGRAGG